MNDDRKIQQYFSRIQNWMPGWIAGSIRTIRKPELGWIRVPIAALLIVGGLLSFLPILGIWMLPLGFLLLAQDIPLLQRPLISIFELTEASFRSVKARLWAK
jgi:hypothetical protein